MDGRRRYQTRFFDGAYTRLAEYFSRFVFSFFHRSRNWNRADSGRKEKIVFGSSFRAIFGNGNVFGNTLGWGNCELVLDVLFAPLEA